MIFVGRLGIVAIHDQEVQHKLVRFFFLFSLINGVTLNSKLWTLKTTVSNLSHNRRICMILHIFIIK